MKQKRDTRHSLRRPNSGKIIAYIQIMACVLTCLFGIMGKENPAYAKEDGFESGYMQTIFNEENGLGSVEVQCIYQTESGHIWIGTDGGLYRYNGSEFKIMNLWNTEKADVYSINDVFQDGQGRFFVATNNYGLFVLENSAFTHFTDDYYEGLKCTRKVVELNGGIYVAANTGLYYLNEETKRLVAVEGTEGKSITDITSNNGKIWGITENGEIFSYNVENSVSYIDSTAYTNDELTCIYARDDKMYIGTNGTDVIFVRDETSFQIIKSYKEGINFIYGDDEDRVFVLADSGVGYFDRINFFNSLNNLQLDSYFSGMMKDYEGNYWFSSNRKGILFMGFSKFTDFGLLYGLGSKQVNCMYENGINKYIGSDDGLMILGASNQIVKNELTDFLKGATIRDINQDKSGALWISTFRRSGIVKYSDSGEIITIGRGAGLPTNNINCTAMLGDDGVVVGTSEGLSIIKNDQVVMNYSPANGMAYSNIISLLVDGEDIYAGSDGGGLYVIKDDMLSEYTEKEGLSSNTVTTIKKGNNGIYIGTDNGICVFNEAIRPLSNIDYSNSIYDMIIDDQKIYIIGSKGVLCTTEEDILSTEPIKERYLSKGDGIQKTISLSHKTILDKNGILYILCDEGIYSLDTNNIPVNDNSPKLIVSEVDVDDKVYSFDSIDEKLTIPRDAKKVSISFGALCYSNRENVRVEYKLEGFDKSPIVISGTDSMQAVYTNLDGGDYTFTIKVVNSDGIESEVVKSFKLTKESSLFEKRTIIILIAAGFIIILVLVLFISMKFKKTVTGKEKEILELSKEHEDVLKKSTAKTDYLANISNEIKIPMNAIISLSEKMLKDSEGDPVYHDDLTKIVSSGNQIIDKVDSIILLARLESGRVPSVNQSYSITTLVCDLSDRLINELSDRPVKFFVEIGENIPDILSGDFDKIKDILLILLDNAQKYTKEGSVILSVDCYQFDTEEKEDNKEVNIVFSVSDTGVGIQEDKLGKIFEGYNISESGKPSGGINLAIAKKLAEILGGDISVESTYGAGSLFTLSITQKLPSSNVFTSEESVQVISKEEAERMWTPDISALLVDDTEVARTGALSVLNQLEMKVDIATNGVSAIDMVMNNRYDVVFMDMSMPVMNGKDAMEEIREFEDEYFKKLPIIAMSEDAVYEERDKVIESGFTDMLIKPIEITNLAAVLSAYMPVEKIKQKTNNMLQYIKESRYKDGLTRLQETLDVPKILDKIGGSIDVYNKILFSFYNTNLNEEELLSGMLKHDFRSFRIRIHNIKTGSINIGATELSKIAGRVESAVNIGNREYAENNLNHLIREMKKVMEALYIYLSFVENEKGITDHEFAIRAARRKDDKKEAESHIEENALSSELDVAKEDAQSEKKEPEQAVIDGELLIVIKKHIRDKKYDKIKPLMDELKIKQYVSEDNEFVEVLTEMISEKNYDEADEILDTYISLKSV